MWVPLALAALNLCRPVDVYAARHNWGQEMCCL